MQVVLPIIPYSTALEEDICKKKRKKKREIYTIQCIKLANIFLLTFLRS